MSQNTWCKIVKTAKDHICYGCDEVILKGTKVNFVQSVDNGEWHHCYWCEVCQTIWNELDWDDQENGICQGEIKSGNRKYWFEVKERLQKKENKIDLFEFLSKLKIYCKNERSCYTCKLSEFCSTKLAILNESQINVIIKEISC